MSQNKINTTLSRRERERENRKNEILDAALKVFAEKGFYNATMDEIAEKAELGKGTIYYYFSTKEDLYLQLLKREEEKLSDELFRFEGKTTSINELVAEISNFFIDYFSKNVEYISILFPLQSGFISFKDGKLVKEIEGLSKEFKHIKLVKKLIQKSLEFTCPYNRNLEEELLYFIAILIRGMGDFIKRGEGEKIKKTVNLILSKLKLCEGEDEVD